MGLFHREAVNVAGEIKDGLKGALGDVVLGCYPVVISEGDESGFSKVEISVQTAEEACIVRDEMHNNEMLREFVGDVTYSVADENSSAESYISHGGTESFGELPPDRAAALVAHMYN